MAENGFLLQDALLALLIAGLLAAAVAAVPVQKGGIHETIDRTWFYAD